MSRDHKINTHQHTAKQLRKKVSHCTVIDPALALLIVLNKVSLHLCDTNLTYMVSHHGIAQVERYLLQQQRKEAKASEAQ